MATAKKNPAPQTATTPKRRALTEAERAAKHAEQAAKFQQLAKARVTRALKAVALIGNLSGPGYKSTPEQVDKIRAALENAVETTMARFSSASKPGADFEL